VVPTQPATTATNFNDNVGASSGDASVDGVADTVTFTIPGAINTTLFALSFNSPSDDWILLNKEKVVVSESSGLPALEGVSTDGETVQVPLGAVGFIEAEFADGQVPACK
jgi:hypothetical protein